MLESVRGRPPDEYLLVYHCRTIEALKNGKPVYRTLNRVRVKLPARYPAPSAPPIIEIKTPIFNPHVYPNQVVCMGSWQTTEYLENTLLRLGAMLQFDRRYMDIRDPANEQAMYWVTQNLLLLPTDTATFQGDDPPLPSPVSLALDDGIPSIETWMRSAKEIQDEAFTGLAEDTSMIWKDIE